MPHQALQQVELAGLQIDGAPVAHRRALHEIEFKSAYAEHGFGPRAAWATSECVDAREQLRESERLYQIVIAAGLQTLDPVVNAAQIGEEKNRGRIALLAQMFDQREPIQRRQHAVDNRHLVAAGPCEQ